MLQRLVECRSTVDTLCTEENWKASLSGVEWNEVVQLTVFLGHFYKFVLAHEVNVGHLKVFNFF
jgi:hypothetical protein